MSRKILITGGAGFIGTNLIRFLTEQGGWDITVLDALIEQVHPNSSWNKPNDITFFHADIRDPGAVADALKGIEYVVHLAAETGVGQSAYEISRYVSANELGTAVLLEQCAKLSSQIKTIVLASSRAVYGEGRYECASCGPIFPEARKAEDLRNSIWEHSCPICSNRLSPIPSQEDQPLAPASIYAITKHNQEQLLNIFSKTHQMPSVILRFQNVYGPGQSLSNPYTGILSLFSTRIRNNKPVLIYEDGLEQRDFVYVSDVVKGIVLALDKKNSFGNIYNIGSGIGTSVLEVAKILEQYVSGRSRIEITGQFRMGDIRHAIAALAQSEEGLGYKPEISVEQGLANFAQWVNDQKVFLDAYEVMENEMKKNKVMD